MTNLNQLRWHIFKDAGQLARDAAERVFRQARHAIGEHGEFNIVLGGSQTPQHMYHYLARGESDWSRWQVFFADEKLSNKDDNLVNYALAQKAFLMNVAIPRTQIHKIMVDAGFDVAIDAYGKQLRRIRAFDQVVLNLGADGHIAGLFPGHDYPEADDMIAVNDGPPPFPERVSMNYPRLNESRKIMILAEGADRRPAVEAWLAGEDLPVARIKGTQGVDVLIDSNAYPPAAQSV